MPTIPVPEPSSTTCLPLNSPGSAHSCRSRNLDRTMAASHTTHPTSPELSWRISSTAPSRRSTSLMNTPDSSVMFEMNQRACAEVP
ncbi:hypothetical protein GDO81_026869 [Engystomops pustulosus]|uniref:Uncharacterized protein n=1 Tax=Engystomops pustulosus TaxID=76066 RepID=A0AAV6YLY8_ENGPU|nr:hypothetical protein GDO81_026869 [Engystomops pustulosus]